MSATDRIYGAAVSLVAIFAVVRSLVFVLEGRL